MWRKGKSKSKKVSEKCTINCSKKTSEKKNKEIKTDEVNGVLNKRNN